MPNKINKRDRSSQLHIFYYIYPNYVLQLSACRRQNQTKTFEITEEKFLLIIGFV